MATRIKLTVAYLGEHFCGWQRQTHGRTVQGELERALSGVTGGHRIAVVGAGRTDAGVHAAGQVAHADLPVAIPMAGLKKALNRVIGPYIRIRSVVPVAASFHARRSALGKVYTYRVQWRSPALPWTGLRTAFVPPISDPRALERAVAMLPGRRDMASFSIPQQMPTERTLYRAWTEDRRNGLILHFVGDGFLRYQVRRMAGAALDVGRGRVELAEFEDLLLRPQPGARVQTAPARGLTLERVFYRDSHCLHLDSE